MILMKSPIPSIIHDRQRGVRRGRDGRHYMVTVENTDGRQARMGDRDGRGYVTVENTDDRQTGEDG